MAIERIREVSGTGLPLRGNNIDTDRIIPARFLRAITFEGLEEHLFEDDRRQAANGEHPHPVSNPAYASASILLVNANFGCGSSREHAPQAIRRRGFKAVVGESFSEIFFGNAVALGMPCVTALPADVDALMRIVESEPSTMLALDLETMRLRAGQLDVQVTLPSAAREAFVEGSWDATGLLLDRYEDVERVMAALPYMRWPRGA